MIAIKKLNPFRSLEHPKRVWAWGMYDLANQSFTLLINTLLFGIFFREVVAAPATGTTGDTLWGLTVAISLAIAVIAGPIIGAVADAYAIKKRLLTLFGAVCVALTASLAIVPISGTTAALALAMTLYIGANVAYNLGENMLAAFLPSLAKRENIGRVSAIGWTMGYVGALSLLVLTGALVALFALDEPTQWRPLFIFAAAWFFVMAIPTVIIVPEAARGETLPESRTVVGAGIKRAASSLKHAADYRDLSAFLTAFFIYGFGVQALIFFAGIIAQSDFNFATGELITFTAVITLSAGVGAVATGIIQDKIGHKQTVALFLALWIANALGLAVLTWAKARHDAQLPHEPFPRWGLWIVGNGVGLGLGGIGSASRACVGFFTPRHRTAEFFGLWGMAWKGAGAIGALGFGTIREQLGGVPSLLTLAAVFALGGAMLALVDVRRGKRTADRAEQRFNAHAGDNQRHPV